MFHVRSDERPNWPNLAPIVANIPASSWLIMMTHVSAHDESQPNWWIQTWRTETWAHWSRGLIASHQSFGGDCEALKAITCYHYVIWLYLVCVCVLERYCRFWCFHSVIWHRKSKSRGTSSAVKTLTCSLWEELGRISSISSFATSQTMLYK